MYCLDIHIDPDGDFGYDCEYLELRGYVSTFIYFYTREDALIAMKRLFDELDSSFHTSKSGLTIIKSWIAEVSSKLLTIAKSLNTFVVEHCFGNQEISVALLECEQQSIQNGFRFSHKPADYGFDEDLDNYNWDAIKEYNDILSSKEIK